MANGIIVIDKAPDWTSHDVVAKLRGILREKRIGHAGTLDPMATGVLPVFVGRATRAVEFAAETGKEYVAGLKLGLRTDTQDSTGTTLETRPVS
ncbi:MAG: pseudouridine synthase, partial [Oscillospiraceae bacterium]